ncbi:MAG: hypothetical protein IJA72_03670, partial [Clostridia bacterium]|nr:hypothetical protein [Clostridia bacterium]
MKLKKILLPIFVWVAILSASLIAVVAGIAIKENRVKGAQRVNSNIESTETPGASNEYFDVSIQDGLYVKIKDYDPEWYSYKMLVEVDGVIVTDNGTNGGYELLNSQTPGFYYNELALQNHNVNVQNVKVHLVRFTGGGASIEVWDGELSATLSKTVLTFDANGGSFSNGSALIKKYYWPGQTIDDKPNAPTHSTRTFSFWNPS